MTEQQTRPPALGTASDEETVKTNLERYRELALQSGASDAVILPGFQTAAGDGLKRGGTGNEIFLAVCGMMSTGSNTILMSRWRTGGQVSFDLSREFVQQLPDSSAARAWRRSVQLAKLGEIDADQEPRVKAPRLDEPVSASHPFFWSGYMLVDTGRSPKRDD